MKRPEFLKNLVALAVGLVAAPKIIKADPYDGGEVHPFKEDEVGLTDPIKKLVKTNDLYLREYPLTPDEAWMVPDETMLGKFDEHKLVFYNQPYCCMGDILVDELERKYLVQSVHVHVSGIEGEKGPSYRWILTIRDINMNQMKKGRSRRRGLMPRLGKQYMIACRTFKEG